MSWSVSGVNTSTPGVPCNLVFQETVPWCERKISSAIRNVPHPVFGVACHEYDIKVSCKLLYDEEIKEGYKDMSLLIRNSQRAVYLRRVPLRKNLEIARQCLQVERFDVGVICISSARIRQINKLYRKRDTATDVLSFPFHEGLRPGFLPEPVFRDEYNLGDIYLGVEYIYRQCQEAQEDFYNVLTVTGVHGLCHLLGYTHDSLDNWKKMFEKENEVLMEINKTTGSTLQPLSTNHFDH